MDFLPSPVHNYSYETFDDGFFELPKEMEFEVSNERRDNMSYSIEDDDDLNDGMYGVWNAKHPWTISNSSSVYNSNLHLDFVGGDPESAMMVNPNIVIPSGFQFDEETNSEKKDAKELLSTIPKAESKESSTQDDTPRRVRNKLLLKENIASVADYGMTVPKNGIRILKPIESNSTANRQKVESTNTRLKASKGNSSIYYQDGHFYPKPAFSYSCLIAMALKNSKDGCLPVAEIYNFMCNHFPYFKTAPNGWKNSVRHNLSLNKCFEKIEKPAGSTQRKGCLWALNPSKAAKLEEEVQKCTKKDVTAIKRAMEYPEHLELLEKGELKSLYDADQIEDDDDDEDDIDLNEDEDIEREEPTICDEDLIDERLSENEPDSGKTENDSEHYPLLNISGSSDFPEFKIEVEDSVYEELIGNIKNDQMFTLSNAAVKAGAKICPAKKVKKVFIAVNSNTVQNGKNDSEIFDHYDINNLLRLENEIKLTQGAGKRTPPQRFNRRVCPNSRIKPIKFKTWN